MKALDLDETFMHYNLSRKNTYNGALSAVKSQIYHLTPYLPFMHVSLYLGTTVGPHLKLSINRWGDHLELVSVCIFHGNSHSSPLTVSPTVSD